MAADVINDIIGLKPHNLDNCFRENFLDCSTQVSAQHVTSPVKSNEMEKEEWEERTCSYLCSGGHLWEQKRGDKTDLGFTAQL